ncbi:transporter [Burkholderia ubonensis]|uniref:Transporter n=1 Tax=Burkholderia ubonensis TaxID=101571 RepID=A0ABD4DV09_9BURK|nr:MFS transporter [Burkholderia ubonensis]KVM03714.1 transporter [Burkholderia ubonensis]KVM17845.1 transporter [Burkholderia ubonensis]KVM52254.1 transporter [Burkholderia ubonensis]KVN77242.1 transporter [Burkholderia ubonensis]KVO10611.1 transporter [Burkholderia ubonensis]
MNTLSGPARALDAASGRNTFVLVAFTALTNLADGVTKVALPLMATALTQSPMYVSCVSLTLTLPWLLVALHVGVLVDRADRRVLLWIANGMRLTVIATLVLLSLSNSITLPVLYAGGLALGIAEVIALTSAAALIPDAVAPAARERANAWVAGAETVCNEFCGPLVGGLLLAAGTAFALGTVAGAYLIGVLVLFLLIGRFRVARATDAPHDPVRSQIIEGLHCLWREPILRLMAVTLTVLCTCWGAWLALMPLFATKVMGLDARGYGIMLSALGIGGFVGAVSVTTLNRWFGRRTVMLFDLLGTLAMMAMPVATVNLWAVAASAFAGGLGGTLWSVNARTISQSLVPGSLLGRYNAAARLFSWGAMPVGAGLGGMLAEWVGMRAALAGFAVVTLLLVVPFLRVATPAALNAEKSSPR